jgi:hypothetical protein
MPILNILSETLMTANPSNKGKIFNIGNTIYTLYSESLPNETFVIQIRNGNNVTTIYTGKYTTIYDFLFDSDTQTLYICGMNIQDQIGFYGSSLYNNGVFGNLQYQEISNTTYIYQIFIYQDTLHFITVDDSSTRLIKLKNEYQEYTIVSGDDATPKDILVDGWNLYIIISNKNSITNLYQIEIYKQFNFTPNIDITSMSIDLISDATYNLIFLGRSFMAGSDYLIYGKQPTLNPSNFNPSQVLNNIVCLYDLISMTDFSNFFFNSVQFQGLSIIETGFNSYAMMGFGYVDSNNYLKYIYLKINLNTGLPVDNYYTSSPSIYISSDRDVEYVYLNQNLHFIVEAKPNLSNNYTNVLYATLNFDETYIPPPDPPTPPPPTPTGSIGSDPHVYTIFGQKYDLLKVSSRNWYNVFEMGQFKIKGHFTGYRNGFFFDKVKIENHKENITVDFQNKKIKGNVERVENQKLSIKYENLTFDKSQGNFIQPKSMDTLRFDSLKYPLDIHIDFKTRYLHFTFLKEKPTIFECSGLLAHK